MIPFYRSPTFAGDRILIPGDIHGQIVSRRHFDLMLKAAHDLKCNRAILPGDTNDNDAMNSHGREAERLVRDGCLARDDEATAKLTREIRECIVKKNEDTFIALEGNHEARVYAFVKKHPEFLGWEWYTPFPKTYTGWKKLPRFAGVQLGPLNVVHGHQLEGFEYGGGKAPASTALSNYPCQNTLFGHTHRIDCDITPVQKDGIQVLHGSWTIGHLSVTAEHKYAIKHRHRWQHGFAIVDFWQLGRSGKKLGFTVHQGRFICDGRGRPFLNILGRTYS